MPLIRSPDIWINYLPSASLKCPSSSCTRPTRTCCAAVSSINEVDLDASLATRHWCCRTRSLHWNPSKGVLCKAPFSSAGADVLSRITGENTDVDPGEGEGRDLREAEVIRSWLFVDNSFRAPELRSPNETTVLVEVNLPNPKVANLGLEKCCMVSIVSRNEPVHFYFSGTLITASKLFVNYIPPGY
ncbi:hypothetical protein CC86DRAFT_422728 [Ophiobolus disseminans]|uniref:Uncharacterized protein n=1 Tax=Ophiobolus disseminans TaxID=1469910 RepID=A0A6A6ZQT9_9PLEO|nr:hypothetical protein CC86DRAFT_422728 [Ophiobolus disseminans]